LQLERLLGLGAWLDTNGEAIFDTQPWQVAEGRTADGADVRFTQRENTLYATVLDTPREGQVVIERLQAAPGATVRLLGRDQPLNWEQTEQGLAIGLAGPLAEAPAHAFAISSQPEWVSA
jgi:alpha-L-fucosidase